MENSEWYAAVLASDQKVCSGINVVKMRYPQVLLMYAEVVNELYGKGATAEGCTLTATAALKEVHDRAFTDATKRDAAWTALMGKTSSMQLLTKMHGNWQEKVFVSST